MKLNSALFIFFQKSVGTPGLTGLDRLLSFMIVTELQSLIRSYEKVILGDKVWQEQLKTLHSVLQPLNKLIRKYLYYFFSQFKYIIKNHLSAIYVLFISLLREIHLIILM